MNAVDMSDSDELVARLVALRDALVNTAQSLRDLQCKMDVEAQKQAGDAMEKMLERFGASPDAGDTGRVAAR